MPNFNDLQIAISDVSGVQLHDNYSYWSSTEYAASNAWYVYTDVGHVSNGNKDYDRYVRAFLAL